MLLLKMQLYLLQLAGACMGEKKKGCLVKGRPHAFPEHYLLYSPLVDFEHGAIPALLTDLRAPWGWRARGTLMVEGGKRQAGSSQGSSLLPAGLCQEAEQDSAADPATLPSPTETVPRAA